MYVEFDLPDLSEYAEKGFPQYWLKILFIRSPSSSYQINALSSTYVRLVEAAIIEYKFGSDKLKELWGTHSSLNVSAMHRSTSHFESCISNMYRATKCFRRLRRDKNQDPLALTINKNKARFASDTIFNRFRTIRNEIHHLEEMVMDGRISDGQSFALKADGPEIPHPTEAKQTIKTIDRLVIGENEVKFSELAKWLKEMMEFVEVISDYLPNSSPSSNGHNTD